MKIRATAVVGKMCVSLISAWDRFLDVWVPEEDATLDEEDAAAAANCVVCLKFSSKDEKPDISKCG